MTDLSMLGRWGAAPIAELVARLSARLGVDAFRVRFALQSMLPADPLSCEGPARVLPTIDVLVPAHPKDLRVLPYAIGAVRRGVSNPIRRIVCVVPDDAVQVMRASLPADCEVEPEGALLGDLLPWIRENVPSMWRGWVIQQCIKLLWVLRNDRPTLVLDADTILLSKRVWIDEAGLQLLCVSAERHAEYVRHAGSVWKLEARSQAVSYVTHHQLVQPAVLAQMYPEERVSLKRWISAADFSQHAALSEYHSYGAWLRTNLPDLTCLGRFGNRGRPGEELDELAADHTIEETLEALHERYPRLLSVSFHSWRNEQ